VVTFAHLQRDIMEARGYHGLAETLTDMLAAGKGETQMLYGKDALEDASGKRRSTLFPMTILTAAGWSDRSRVSPKG